MVPSAQRKTGSINARVAPALKADAENVLRTLGVSTSEAISMFLSQVVLHQGLPFPVLIPIAETIAALKQVREKPETLTTYKNVDAMMGDVWPRKRGAK